MSAATNVITMPTQAAVDAAWERCRAINAESIEDPKRLLDREFLQASIRVNEEFRQAYLAWLDRQ